MKNSVMPLGKTCANGAYAIVMACALMLGACHSELAPEAHTTAFSLSDTMLTRIELDTVQTEVVHDELQLNAKIAADESRLVDVYPIMAGNVVEVNAELGDYVKKGQVLAVIRSGDVAELERELIDAKSSVSLAEKNLAVQRELYQSKMATDREVSAAEKDLNQAKAELKRVQELFSIYSMTDRSEYVVKAPIEGFVIERNINRDMTLPPGFANNIFRIARLDEVWTVANVYESDIARIALGMKADITTLSYPDQVFTGTIDKIFSVLNPETKTNSVRIRLANADYKLKPEMLAIVKLKFEEKQQFPAVPSAAVIFDNNRNYVMVFHDRNNIETREVQVYRTTGSTTWIQSGLQPGEVIVGKNQLFIYDALND